MRFLLLLLILLGCSTQLPLKFKYSSSQRYLASLTRDDVVVHKISGQVKNLVIFASGMDSTWLTVRLYDSEGNELIDVDPNDLTLSTSEDVKAKPFVRKQGVYKAEILPRVKSKTIRMRVDWKEKIWSEEIILRTTVAPLKNNLLPLDHEYFQSKSFGEINVSKGSASPENSTEGFSIENLGENRIVDTTKNKSAHRVFNFDYLEQARQNVGLEVDDAANDTVSHTMHSLFMFFPRKQLPVVEQLTGTVDVTLPTSEKMIFRKDSKEIVDGVFLEGPVDLSADRFKRQYADLRYKGKGVILRANARGQSPQLGQYELVQIDLEFGLRGSADVLILNGSTGQRCRRPKTDFWDNIDVSPIEFKFPTDEGFDSYLKKNCGFGLPKF
jgi:hypothetical protein